MGRLCRLISASFSCVLALQHQRCVPPQLAMQVLQYPTNLQSGEKRTKQRNCRRHSTNLTHFVHNSSKLLSLLSQYIILLWCARLLPDSRIMILLPHDTAAVPWQ